MTFPLALGRSNLRTVQRQIRVPIEEEMSADPAPAPQTEPKMDAKMVAKEMVAKAKATAGYDLEAGIGLDFEGILEPVPIADPAAFAQRLVDAAGEGGGVVLNFTGPTVLPPLEIEDIHDKPHSGHHPDPGDEPDEE